MDSHTIIITEMDSINCVTSSISSEYVVEEPYDYIFEPDHYPLRHTDKEHQKQTCSIEEKDGILIYEHSTRSSSSNNNNNHHHHLNALLRNISLSKSPHTGFGFDLSRENDLMYVSNIVPDSPAEFCLQLGDVLIEIDEMNPCESFLDMSQLMDYLNTKELIYLMAIHHTKYMQLKSSDKEINDWCTNCKDVVIVSWNESYQFENLKPR
jgi:hypothetical protein